MSEGTGGESESGLGRAVARHALVWLVAGCGVGLILATLLAFPRLGAVLGPITYGRLMALHLDLTLYGWIALPIVGLLFRAFAVERRSAFARAGRAALWLWSAALAAGAVSWLSGRSSGKLFLDWSGGARTVFLAALVALLALFVVAAFERAPAPAARPAAVPPSLPRPPIPQLARVAIVFLLAAVPAALYAATGPGYPPVNPVSGGPTGTSLLGSTLALALILLALPRLAHLERGSGASRSPLVQWLPFAALGAHIAAFALFASGERSNDDPVEVVALASALFWAVVVPLDLFRFVWPRAARPWSRAAVGWGLVLAVAGFVQFLPAPLAAAKFTHLLVAHAHLAMAGFASAVAFLLLELALESKSEAPLGRRPLFALWQGGTVAQVAALAGVGLLEARDPAAFLRGSLAISLLLALRWLGGAAMLAAAGLALRRAGEEG